MRKHFPIAWIFNNARNENKLQPLAFTACFVTGGGGGEGFIPGGKEAAQYQWKCIYEGQVIRHFRWEQTKIKKIVQPGVLGQGLLLKCTPSSVYLLPFYGYFPQSQVGMVIATFLPMPSPGPSFVLMEEDTPSRPLSLSEGKNPSPSPFHG